MRALLFFVLVVIVFLLIRFVFKRIDQFRQNDLMSDSNDETPQPQEQAMVRCEQCGVHLPQGDAISVEANTVEGHNALLYFCSKEHLETYINEREK